jgi:hypothetical protein
LTALRVGRLDLLRGAARVVEAAPEIDGRLHWGGVKTHEARTVRLPRSIAEELAVDLAGRPCDPDALVFTAPLGGPPAYMGQELLQAGGPCGRATPGVAVVRPAAHLRVAADRPGRRRQGCAGATRPRHRQHHPDTYGHLFPSELEALADRLEQARTAALADRERTQRGPAVVALGERAGS